MYFYSWYWFAKLLVVATQYFPMYWLIIANLRKYFFQVNTSTCLDLFRKKNLEKSRNQILLWFHEFFFSPRIGGIFRSHRKEINKEPETGFCRYIIKKPAVFWRVFWSRIKIEESMATVLKTSVLTTEISFSSHHES